MCRAIIEAMSRACPCIVSNVGGNPELIDERYIFKRQNIIDLLNKLVDIINNEMEEQAKVNFSNAKKYYKEYIDKLRNNFYESIIK